MSEYWKSTPKYWCKHCSTYVKDTKLEKSNHESSSKHQTNLKRFLRNVHKANEKTEREKEMAKKEIARLNGSSREEEDAGADTSSKSKYSAPSRQATVEERRAQMMQLAAMGVSVPEEFRKEMAMISEWHVVSESISDSSKKLTRGKDSSDAFLPQRATQKRKAVDSAPDLNTTGSLKATWGSATKTFHDTKDDVDDLDTLLLTRTNPFIGKISNKSNMPLNETDYDGAEARAVGDTTNDTTLSQSRGMSGNLRQLNSEEDVVFKKRRLKPKK